LEKGGFMKDPMGFVHMRGLIVKNLATDLNVITRLPDGYRPSATLQFPARCGNGTMCYIAISSSGELAFGGSSEDAPLQSLTLDGIVFDPR
jgi:hypothetical protein